MSIARRKAICLFVALHVLLRVYPQDVSSLVPQPVAPVTPEVSALFRMQEIPVSLCNGQPDIRVPLGEFRLKGFTHPISLRYQWGGIRVDDVPSSAGSGWTLQAGGALSVAVRGKPDMSKGFPGPEAPVPPGLIQNPWETPPVWAPGKNADPRYEWFKHIADSRTDTEPDLFSFTAGAFSGKFFFDYRGFVHPIPLRKIQVSGLFRIRDEDGNAYYFDLRETADIDNGGSSTQFHLTKIVTPLLDSIVFHYEPQNFTYNAYLGESRFRWISGVRDPMLPAAADIHPARTSIAPCRVNGWRLKEISASNGTRLRLIYATIPRTDLPGTYALTAVEWLFQNALRKRYRLVHSYRGDTRSPEGHRLRLNEVFEEGTDGKRLPSWIFGYNDVIRLPHRLSNRQDHWGYANGTGASGGSRLPGQAAYFPTGVNRAPDATFSGAEMLVSIRYPTGGSTLFHAEPNYIWVKSEASGFTFQGGAGCTGVPNSTTSTVFTIPQGAYDLRVQYNTYPSLTPRRYTLHDMEYTDEPACIITLQMPGKPLQFISGRHSHPSGDPVSYPPGNYTVRIETYGENPSGYWQLTYKKDSVTFYTGPKMVGGWRIRAVENMDPLHPHVKDVKSYHYGRSDGEPEKSSGICPARPVYEYQQEVCQYKPRLDRGAWGEFNLSYELQCARLMIQHSTSLSGILGDHGPVFYPRVEVRDGIDGAAGRTVHTFFFKPQDGGGTGYPFVPRANYDGYNGQTQTIQRYRKTASGAYQLTESETYAWTFVPDEVYWRHWYQENPPPEAFRGLGMHVSYLLRESHFELRKSTAVFLTGVYRYHSKWFRCDSIIRIQYPDSGPPLQTVTCFQFGNPVHLQPTKITTLGSGKVALVSLTKYPGDYTGDAALTALMNSNQIRKTVEQWKLRDQLTERHIRIRYRLWHGGAFVLPDTVFSASHGRGLQPEASFLYDRHGNLVETTTRNGITRSTLWGYGHSLPVAEITGSSHANALRKISDNVLQRPINDVALRTELQKLRAGAWPGLTEIKTFTHSPLTGVTSITNPDGRTTYFEYDGFGRLGIVRDHEGNILTMHRYAYQAPQQE